MAETNKKVILKALWVSLCNSIGCLSNKEIETLNESKALIEELIAKVIKEALLTKAASIELDKDRMAIQSMIGDMEKCAKDLQEKFPLEVLEKLKAWDHKWRVEKEKTKCTHNTDTQFML